MVYHTVCGFFVRSIHIAPMSHKVSCLVIFRGIVCVTTSGLETVEPEAQVPRNLADKHLWAPVDSRAFIANLPVSSQVATTEG